MQNFGTSVDSLFRNTVAQYRDKIALIFGEQQLSFTELEQQIEVLARALHAQGIGKGDCVILYLPHRVEWVVIWFALQRIGAIIVPVPHFFLQDNLLFKANDCAATALFCSKNKLDSVLAVLPDCMIKNVIVADSESPLSIGIEINPNVQVSSYSDFLCHSSSPFDRVIFSPDDTAEIIYTSGTSGPPKGIQISQGLLLELFEEYTHQITRVIPAGKGLAVQGSFLNHFYGQEKGLGNLLTGNTLVLLPKFDPELLLNAIDKYQANILYGTPTMFRMILDYEQLENFDLTSLQCIFVSGEALPLKLAQQWVEKFGIPLLPCYGCTEAGLITAVIPNTVFPADTIGKFIPTKVTLLFDSETMQPATGNCGELLVASKYMPTSYYHGPDESAKRFLFINHRLWFNTGDIVEISPEGWVFYKERSSEIIKHKGYRVGPSKIENVLSQHESIGTCCIVGVPDTNVGEIVIAFVVLNPDSENVTAEDLTVWCTKRLVYYEIPQKFIFRNELPQSSNGKVLRKVLKKEALTMISEN